MHLLRALLYLRLNSARNLLRTRLARLRQPKYLVGALAGGLYIWFFFLRGSGPGAPGKALDLAFGEGRAEYLAAGILLIFVLLIWVLPGSQPGLSFSEAEVAFLFPAPLTRRQLIHYKLLDGLVISLFSALVFTLISTGTRQGWLGALRHLGAWWSLNVNLSLHQTAAALTIAQLTRWGLNAPLRRFLLLAGAFLGLVALALYAVNNDPASLAWLLWPARLAVRPFLADSLGAYALALVPALGLVAFHYFWVHRFESPFEDASLARAKKAGETLARLRSGRGLRTGPAKARREPFRLRARLPVEFAFLWKNLMVAPAYFNRRVFLGAALVFTAGILWLQRQPDPTIARGSLVIGFIALVLLVYLLVFGPQLARNDLRGDLLNADLLKTYPLPGWRIVLGSLLAPTVILTGIAWLLLLTAALGLTPPNDRLAWLTPSFRLAAGLAAAVVMPALCAVQLLVPNAATLIFPAWAQNSRNLGGGMDVMGQRLIFFAGQMICLALALVPAVLAGGATIFLTSWLIGLPAATALAALPVLFIFALELWLGVVWLGPKFEQLDISAELRP